MLKVKFDELKLSTSCGEISAVAWGPQDGVPVLAIHGWLDHRLSFQRLAPLLHKKFRFVAIDLSGHGKSHHIPKGYRYHIIDWVCDLKEIIEQLGWTRPHIVAHSLGGAIGLFFAAIRPENVHKIVLFDSLGPINVEPENLVERSRLYFSQSSDLPKAPRKPAQLTALVEARKKSTRDLTGAILTDDVAEILVKGAFRETVDGWMALTDPRMRLSSVSPFTLAHVMAYLRAVESPILLYRAKKGISFSSTATYDWNARLAALRNVREIQIDGDHFVHLSQPSLCADEVNAFLLA